MAKSGCVLHPVCEHIVVLIHAIMDQISQPYLMLSSWIFSVLVAVILQYYENACCSFMSV